MIKLSGRHLARQIVCAKVNSQSCYKLLLNNKNRIFPCRELNPVIQGESRCDNHYIKETWIITEYLIMLCNFALTAEVIKPVQCVPIEKEILINLFC